MIKLKEYKSKYKDALMLFHLNNEDGKYTILPIKALESTFSNPNKTAVVVMKESIPVGFFILHIGGKISEFINSKNTILIRSLSIDDKYHRQGIATEAMLQVDDFIRDKYSHINRIALAVNMKNPKAIDLYFKAGYKEDHKQLGIKGEQMILIKNL